MQGLGKYVRHAIAGLIGWLAAYASERFGFVVDAETQAAIVVIVYAVVEKLLKRFRWIDAEGWAEREWSKEAAAATSHTSAAIASEKIRAGEV